MHILFVILVHFANKRRLLSNSTILNNSKTIGDINDRIARGI